ncbi:hypothetical protein [Paraglaciecola sp. T6c]|nr:hypothetical protein [Paraglaciecola sp. T6c]
MTAATNKLDIGSPATSVDLKRIETQIGCVAVCA